MVMPVKHYYRVVFESRTDDMFGYQDGWFVNVRTAMNNAVDTKEFLVTKVMQNIHDEWVEVWKL